MSILSDMDSMITTGFSATAQAAAIAAAGPIMDLPGLAQLAKMQAQELKKTIQALDANVGSGADSAVQTILTNTLTAIG